MKGDCFYFEKQGLRVSDIYENQVKDIEITAGSQFQSKECKVCGLDT